MTPATFGQKLTQLRKARGWSQEYIAGELGISQQGYSLYESDAIREVPSSKLAKLCALFDIRAEELLIFLTGEPSHA